MKIFNEREIHARNEIKLEKYSSLIAIEAKVLCDIARNHVIPTAINYQNTLIKNVTGLKEIFGEKEYKKYSKEQLDLLVECKKETDYMYYDGKLIEDWVTKYYINKESWKND
jgi:glutamine synthetase